MAYIEAMAGGLPAIGCRGEPGPEEIAAAGDGFVLVPPGDIERLTQRIDELLSDPHRLREACQRARATVAANFTWERCGEQTLAAYEHALRATTRRSHVLFVTGHAPARPGRRLRAPARAEDVEFALFGGRSKHGGRRRVRRELLPFPAPPHPPARARARSPRAGAIARSSAPPAGASRCPRPGRARAARGAADPLDRPVGAPAQRRARAQLPRAATPVPLRGRGRDLRTPRQRLRPRPRRAQRLHRAAGRRQRLLERPERRAAERSPRRPERGRAAASKFRLSGAPPGKRV